MATLSEVIEEGVISADSHIIEPPSLWTERIEARLRADAPRVERIDGSDWWIYRGRRIGSVSGRKRRSGSLLHEGVLPSRGAVLTHSVFEDVDPAAYTPSLYIASNCNDGVTGAVIRPTQGITNYCIAEADMFGGICRAYNNWIAEFCSEDPAQLKGMAMLNNYDPDDAVREIERARKLGLVGGIISCYPGAEHHYGLPEYDRMWAAATAHRFPISLHVLTNHNGPYGVAFDRTNYSLRVNAEYWFRMSVADMIFHGVFERHPKLIVESSEHEGAWVPYFLWQMDWTWERRIKKRLQASPMKRAPSEYFRNNVFVSIIYDRLAIEARDQIGVERLLWGSDFPHEQSTNPNSKAFLAELLEGVDPDTARAILHTNAAQLFGFDSASAPALRSEDGRQHVALAC